MAEISVEERSRVPQHLLPFFRPSFTTEPPVSETHSSHASPNTSSERSVELVPAHWRLPPKRRLRETLKNIVLKDWSHTYPRTLSRSPQRSRPSIMRMKDSDDYITARAANPRTGLISPSVGTLTPRPPRTPGSPGEALKLGKDEKQMSPTPEMKARPALKRANEGRKVSAGKWRSDAKGWIDQVGGSVASPKMTHSTAGTGLLETGLMSSPSEDQFVVHMPSAGEPQPFAYPGYSARQIEAYEHYKRKTRRVSSEGYDQRLLSGPRRTSGGEHVIDDEKFDYSHRVACPGPAQIPSDRIVMKKRAAPPIQVSDLARRGKEKDCNAGAELTATTFAPFSAPKTRSIRSTDGQSTALECIQSTGNTAMHPKPVAAHQQGNGRAIYRTDLEAEHSHSSPDLRYLPSVHLVHPNHAALPQPHSLRQPFGVAERKCSLGCRQDSNSDGCNERRSVSTSAKPMLFDNNAGKIATHTDRERSYHLPGVSVPQACQPYDTLVKVVISAIESFRHVQLPPLPKIAMLEVLRSDITTPQQKVAALKTLLYIVGQALLIITALAMVWELGIFIANLVEMVFWPLTLPFRLLRWIGGAA